MSICSPALDLSSAAASATAAASLPSTSAILPPPSTQAAAHALAASASAASAAPTMLQALEEQDMPMASEVRPAKPATSDEHETPLPLLSPPASAPSGCSNRTYTARSTCSLLKPCSAAAASHTGDNPAATISAVEEDMKNHTMLDIESTT